MKINIIKYSAIACLAMAAVSCEDFLDVKPESSFTNDEIFSSETESKAMLSTVYAKLTDNNLYGMALPYTFGTNTDVEMRTNSTQTSTSGNGDDVHCFDVRSLWTSLERTWNAAYEAINYANDFIENMEQSPLFSTEVAAAGPTNMQHMYGEAKCLRAMLYLDLMRTWGDVVYRTKPSSAGDNFYNEGVTDRNVIYDNLIKDLQSAEAYMKYASDLEEGVERASREYCQALIGQLALYRGGYSLRPGGAEGQMERPADYMDYYTIARTYLKKVIDEQRHSLDRESYAQMWFNECNWTVLKNGDVIFEVPMLREYSSNIGYQVGVGIGFDTDNPTHAYGQCSNRVTLSGLYPFSFDPRDLRLDVTCVPYSYDQELNQILAVGKSAVAGWGIGKWSKLNMQTPMVGVQGNTGINSIRMRYADVLLMFAEVENEINGPSADAREALKKVRRRAFAPADQAEMVDTYVDALTTPDMFFQAIVNERSWEFGGEGVRKYDLARWNLYGSTIKNLYDQLTYWGQNSRGGDDFVRGEIFYRAVPDPANPAREILEFKGLKEYGDQIGDHPSSEGWKTYAYATNWWDRNKETGEYEVHDDVKWSFRGFINYNNAASVQATDPVRYLMPYPSRVITSHRGSIQQQYGYR